MPCHPALARIRAVCLDAGNVLKCVDRKRVARLLRDSGHSPDLRKWDAAELAGRDAINQLAALPGSSDHDHARAYWGALLERMDVPADRLETMREIISAESRRLNIWKCAIPGATDVLRELRRRGYPLAVISNADGRCEDDLNGIGVGDCLDFIVDSRLVGVEKPNPAIFRCAADRLGLPTQEICFVGDIFHIDVVGSQGAGMVPVLIDPRGRSPFGECITIRKLDELPMLLPEKPDSRVA